MNFPLIQGLALTMKHFFTKPVTLQYPEERSALPERFRGRPALRMTDDGKPLCGGCGLCEKVCPSRCIKVAAGKGPDGKRALAAYTLDLNRCSFCGFCAEVCPMDAIVMSDAFELATYDRGDLVLTEETLPSRRGGNGGDANKEERGSGRHGNNGNGSGAVKESGDGRRKEEAN